MLSTITPAKIPLAVIVLNNPSPREEYQPPRFQFLSRAEVRKIAGIHEKTGFKIGFN
jgi:hypothetical protein